MADASILTIGICPCWDLTCAVDGIGWGDHKRIASQTRVPAGKALNIARALDGLGIASIAAGLWGEADYPAMLDALAAAWLRVQPAFTAVPGSTRTNVTVLDTRDRREMHLRAADTLATDAALRQLAADLAELPRADIAVFAGSMPPAHVEACLGLMRQVRDQGSRVVVDTSGAALAAAVAQGGLFAIKPNVAELCELLGREVADEPAALIEAGRSLCEAVETVLISRGEAGALTVTRDAAIGCRAAGPDRPVVHTVGCGDFLLAGLLSRIGGGDLEAALQTGVRAATARAWGMDISQGGFEAIDVETVRY